jgi:transposase InsO family protein
VALEPGDCVSFDIWSSGMAHIHGGQQYVIGFHDQHSTVNKFYLLHKKSDSAEALKLYLAWTRSYKVDVRRFHRDNALEFDVEPIREECKRRGIRLSSCAPNEPRGNGIMERQWRTFANYARCAISRAESQGAHYTSCWWYFFRNAMMVSWSLPDSAGVSPWFKSSLVGSLTGCRIAFLGA